MSRGTLPPDDPDTALGVLLGSMGYGEWQPGLPPGEYYEGMLDDFEAYPTPMGWVHRRRRPQVIDSRTTK